MDSDLTVTTERFSADIEAKRYIARFRDADRFIGFCRQCGNFGRRHGCPPFDHDTLSDIAGYARVRILGAKIVPSDKSLPLAAVNDLMLPVITSMNAELLEMEKSLGGRAFGFVGKCIYCGDKPCARIDASRVATPTRCARRSKPTDSTLSARQANCLASTSNGATANTSLTT